MNTILPFVKRAIITIDSRSNDRTKDIVAGLALRYGNVEWSVYPVMNPRVDLVAMRNEQLSKITEEFGWIVDADEYHPFVADYHFGLGDAYGFFCWAPWTSRLAHRASSKNPIGRVFRMKPTLKWRGYFGKEVLYDGGKKVFEGMSFLPDRYIHLTHWKKDDAWRREMNQHRVADGKFLSEMPVNIIEYVKSLPIVREREVPEGDKFR